METTHYLQDQPVKIIGRENRREVWIEQTDGTILRVVKAGLSTTPPDTTPRIGVANLRIDNSYGTDGAR